MREIDRLLDNIKTREGLRSDYKLALFLQIPESTIASYRHGRSLPDERACQKLGAALGEDGDVLAARMYADRSRNDESRAIWTRIADRLASAAVAIFAASAITLIATNPLPARAEPQKVAQTSEGLSILLSWLRAQWHRWCKVLALRPICRAF